MLTWWAKRMGRTSRRHQAAFQSTRPGASVSGPFRAFVTQFSASGSALVYSTYLGGTNGHDYGHDVALDDAGNAYITGRTSSDNFPTLNPVQSWVGPIYHDWAFVTKLNATGSALIYSTYLGGETGARAGVALRTVGEAIALDSGGNTYVTGSTAATDFPTTDGAFDRICTYTGLDCVDAFVTKLNPAGSALVYSNVHRRQWPRIPSRRAGPDVAVDIAGSADVIGTTTSSDFPTRERYSGDKPSGNTDAFVTVFDPAGSGLRLLHLSGREHRRRRHRDSSRCQRERVRHRRNVVHRLSNRGRVSDNRRRRARVHNVMASSRRSQRSAVAIQLRPSTPRHLREASAARWMSARPPAVHGAHPAPSRGSPSPQAQRAAAVALSATPWRPTSRPTPEPAA